MLGSWVRLAGSFLVSEELVVRLRLVSDVEKLLNGTLMTNNNFGSTLRHCCKRLVKVELVGELVLSVHKSQCVLLEGLDVPQGVQVVSLIGD